MINEDITVLAMIKGEERYVFLYNEANRTELLRTLGRYAADPELSFSWYDAAVMSKKVRDIAYSEISAQASNSQGYCQSTLARRFSLHPEEDII